MKAATENDATRGGRRNMEARSQGHLMTPPPRTQLCDTPLASVICRAVETGAIEVGSHSQRQAYASWAIRGAMCVANALGWCGRFARFLHLMHR